MFCADREPPPALMIRFVALSGPPSLSLALASSSAWVIVRALLSSSIEVSVTAAVVGASLTGVISSVAVPVMSFDQWVMYYPSWQEVATTILPVAYGIILIMISYRYLPIFPQEAELNPIEEEKPAAVETPTESTPDLEPANA